jgi:dienelactone hydrolase
MRSLALLAGAVHLAISPASALADQPVDIRVTGLPPEAAVTVAATTRDFDGRTWSSRIRYRADARGVVDTDANARIFWSMHGPRRDISFVPPFGPTPVTITAAVERRVVARGVLLRRGEAAGVTEHRTTLASEGFVGRYFRAPPGPTAPAVLVLGGSEGGLRPYPAALLASHGYSALALAYLREPGLPRDLQNVPLEYFATALRWLAAQPGVDPKRVVVLGASRGGEAALLLGATYPDLVHGVIAASTSDRVLGGIPSGYAWTLGGKPVAESQIPVEQIAGPVLAFAGGKDELLTAREAVARIVARARSHQRLDVQAVVYPKAGHGTVLTPNVPFAPVVEFRPGVLLDLGGSPAANAAAHVDSWRRILHFLATLP